MKNEIKFYVTLFLGFVLLLIGCFIPPEGVISTSLLCGSGMLLTLSAGLIGVDLSKIIREFRFLRAQIELTDEEKQSIKEAYIEDLKK